MTEAVAQPVPCAQTRIREPVGDRTLGDAVSVGGIGADIVVPGVSAGVALRIKRRKGIWVIGPESHNPGGEALARFDGLALAGPRDLRRNDVVAVGDAQLVVTDVSGTLLRLDVCHLVGNITVAPAAMTAAVGPAGDEELEIQAGRIPAIAKPESFSKASTEAVLTMRRRTEWAVSAIVAVALIAGVIVSQMKPIILSVLPADARILTPGTLIAVRAGDRLLLLPGRHTVRAERAGFVPAQAVVSLGRGQTTELILRLVRLPGGRQIDPRGAAAKGFVGGMPRSGGSRESATIRDDPAVAPDSRSRQTTA